MKKTFNLKRFLVKKMIFLKFLKKLKVKPWDIKKKIIS